MNRHMYTRIARFSALSLIFILLFCLTGNIRHSLAAPEQQSEPPFETFTLPEEALSWNPEDLDRQTSVQKHPKLDTQLLNLINAADREARDALLESGGLRMMDGRVQVKITTQKKGLQNATAAVVEAGGFVTKTSNDETFFQAWLPISAIKTVAEHEEIYYIRPPYQFFTMDEVQAGNQTTEGLAEMNGDVWHAASILGDGVKVAIIDGGFQSYANLLGTDLPSSVTVKNFVDGETNADINTSGGVHGLACAEIVYDVAPQAQLFLAKIATPLDLQEAVNWSIGNNVDIISTSGGFYNVTPGDGTGFFEDLVQDARASGVLWITAAGNIRERHWGGVYNDPDNIGGHYFNGTSSINFFGPGDGSAYGIPAGYPIEIHMRWDDWTDVDQDYDLFFYRYTTDYGWVQAAYSQNYQNGGVGQRPTESIFFITTAETSAYGFLITRRDSTRNVNFEVFTPTVPHLNFYRHDRSLPSLGDAASAMTVGAVDVVSPYPQEPYSSQGPTNGPGGEETGGFFKPDIAAFANVSTVSYGSTNFAGTSAATPHVAGAAALALSAYPEYNPDQLQTFLEGRVIDVGLPAMDTIYGHGRLYLGDLPTADPTPSVSSITPNMGENMDILTVNVSGTNFSPDAKVKLTMTGQNDIIATNVVVDSSTQISCDIDLMGAVTGAWDVVVIKPDGQSGTLTDGFTASASSDPYTWELVHDENPWPRRDRHSTVVMNDGSIVLMGGYHYLRHVDEYIHLNDVWRSTDQGTTWEQMTDDAEWIGRVNHTSLVLPDGSIILMGGEICEDSLNCIAYNDVWRSTDQGANWMQMTDDAPWVARAKHTSVVLSDESIVLMGGASCESIYDSDCVSHNDVWRSTDQGASWTLVTDHAEWEIRYGHSSVTMIDGSILLFGGKVHSEFIPINDVWRSTDQGATWEMITDDAEWMNRYNHTSVALADGSIVLMGGDNRSSLFNDVWRSIDQGETWTQMTADAEWPERSSHTSVVLPDESIVLIGGCSDYGLRNDVWRSTGHGAHWTQMDSWMARASHSSVVMPDESIVLMGGYNAVDLNDVWRSTDQGINWMIMTVSAEWGPRQTGNSTVVLSDGSIVLMGGWVKDIGIMNDVWRSTDKGATWTQMTDHAEWTARIVQSSVALPDDSIVLMGSNSLNDVWRSTDQGASWTQMTDSAEWSTRVSTSSVALPDGSIVLMGGYHNKSYLNDVWRSTDQGATWTQMNAAAWPARRDHTSVVLPDGSIVVLGGSGVSGRKNDVWRSTDQGASWKQLSMEAEWTARNQHTSVALADGTIVLMGGFDAKWNALTKDVWQWATGIGEQPEPAPIVFNITPNTGENTGVIDVSISGANFLSGASVKLTLTGQDDIIATDVDVYSASQISCSFDLAGAATGAWDVVVTNPDAQSGTLTDGFTVTSSQPKWSIYLPLILR